MFAGGVKGLTYPGTLDYLDNPGGLHSSSLDCISRVGGTSVGSITAFLFGLKYSPKDIESIFRDMNFLDYLDGEPRVLEILQNSHYKLTATARLELLQHFFPELDTEINLAMRNDFWRYWYFVKYLIYTQQIIFPLAGLLWGAYSISKILKKFNHLAYSAAHAFTNVDPNSPTIEQYLEARYTSISMGIEVFAHDRKKLFYMCLMNFIPALISMAVYVYNSPFSYTKETIDTLLSQISHRVSLFTGEKPRNWFENHIRKRTKELGREIVNATFRELYEFCDEHNERVFRDMYFVGLNIAKQITEIFSYEHTPDMVVADAIRISMSIPGVFRPHYFYYKLRNGTVVCDESRGLYVDGGLNDNYPIWLFDDARYVTNRETQWIMQELNAVLGNRSGCFRHHNPETLGFMLGTSRDEIHTLSGEKPISPQEIKNITDFITFVMQLMLLNKQASDHMLSADNLRTIYINTADYHTTDFNLDIHAKDRLVRLGDGQLGTM